MNKTIMQIATEKHINKVCIDGMIKDIRQLDKKQLEGQNGKHGKERKQSIILSKNYQA